jgi:hypothetical protein|tara:strand:- start:1388 stop:1552 length:165 start_codon:yes stop_codon:yes gene_type:complete
MPVPTNAIIMSGMGEKDGNDHTPSKNSVPNNTNNVRMIAKDIIPAIDLFIVSLI